MTYTGLVIGTPKFPLLKKVITSCMLGKNAQEKEKDPKNIGLCPQLDHLS
jgi:hypothetical protein